jgi:Mn2+/Fe2+ NRAMP family transporter
MRRLAAVAVQSAVAAAFIGPGTVTTCAASGAGFGFALLWALAFSTLATFALQEASARLTTVSGLDLARALRLRAAGGRRGDRSDGRPPGAGVALPGSASGLAGESDPGTGSTPPGSASASAGDLGSGAGRSASLGIGGVAVLALVLAAVVVGCAAYEAGNVLGAVAGAALVVELPRAALTLAVVALAGTLLAAGSPRRVALALSGLVAVMGVAFLLTAALLRPPAAALAAGLAVPSLPAGSGLLALGLVGTTVVPYNLFLGSGLAAGQRLGEVRFGLAVAIGLGGLISMGVVVVGTAVDGPFSYQAVAAVLAGRLGAWAGWLFAAGLFAAGLTSAVTAPLAAALTARGLFMRPGPDGADPRWSERGWRFRAVWAGVLATGLAFGLSGVRPVPAIVLAQAANGLLLPAVAVFLLLAVNDRRLLGTAAAGGGPVSGSGGPAGGLNGPLSNAAMAAAVAVTLVLGLGQLGRAGTAVLGLAPPDEGVLLACAAVVAAALAVPLALRVRRARRG